MLSTPSTATFLIGRPDHCGNCSAISRVTRSAVISALRTGRDCGTGAAGRHLVFRCDPQHPARPGQIRPDLVDWTRRGVVPRWLADIPARAPGRQAAFWWTRPSAVELFRPRSQRSDPGRYPTEEAFMHYLAVIGIALVVTFLAELPDKSMFASLVMGTRYRPAWVWAGAAAAFTVHMAIAVTAGAAARAAAAPDPGRGDRRAVRRRGRVPVVVQLPPGRPRRLGRRPHGRARAHVLADAAAPASRSSSSPNGATSRRSRPRTSRLGTARSPYSSAPPWVVGRRLGRGEHRREEPERAPDGLDPAHHRDHPARPGDLHRDLGLLAEAGRPELRSAVSRPRSESLDSRRSVTEAITVMGS